MMYPNLYVIDVETTGLDVSKRDLWNLALVPFDGGPSLNLYVTLPKPSSWDAAAHSFFKPVEARYNREAITPQQAVAAVDKYLSYRDEPMEAVTLAGHNVGFDVGFLAKLERSAGQALSNVSHRTVDTHTLLWALVGQGRLPSSVLTSRGAFEFFGLDLSTAHTAHGDAHNTRILLYRLLDLLHGATAPAA